MPNLPTYLIRSYLTHGHNKPQLPAELERPFLFGGIFVLTGFVFFWTPNTRETTPMPPQRRGFVVRFGSATGLLAPPPRPLFLFSYQ